MSFQPYRTLGSQFISLRIHDQCQVEYDGKRCPNKAVYFVTGLCFYFRCEKCTKGTRYFVKPIEEYIIDRAEKALELEEACGGHDYPR